MTKRRTRRANAEPVRCTECPRTTATPRRGKCWPCYLRAWRGHELAGACRICGADDRRILRRHTLADGEVTLCANDAAIAAAIGGPSGASGRTLAELELELATPGDRRAADRRRADRRSLERRGADLGPVAPNAPERRALARRLGDAVASL